MAAGHLFTVMRVAYQSGNSSLITSRFCPNTAIKGAEVHTVPWLDSAQLGLVLSRQPTPVITGLKLPSCCVFNRHPEREEEGTWHIHVKGLSWE